MPSFKGLLSIGVDDISNTLVLSCPGYFFDDLLKIVEDLDEAASPTKPTVRVLQMDQGVSARHMQSLLSGVLSGKSSRGKPPAPKPEGQPRPGGPPGGGSMSAYGRR